MSGHAFQAWGGRTAVQWSVAEIAARVDGVVVGDAARVVTGLNGIREAGAAELTFLANKKYLPYLKTTAAAAILVPDESVLPEAKRIAANGHTLIRVADPYRAFMLLLADVEQKTARHPAGIHQTAVLGNNVRLGDGVALDAHVRIGDDVIIGDGAILYSGAYIGNGCQIGANTIIYPNATVRENCRIGDRCIIHSNAAIGSDGFGFVQFDGRHRKIPQVGCVVIGNDVEIGSHTAIDRATCGETIIGDGTKIDNLVQIGHNVRIGRHCTISGCSGIAGSAVVGDYVTIAAFAGVAGHIEIGDHVIVAGRGGVTKSVKPRTVVSGFPAQPHGVERRVVAAQRKLPETLKRLRELEKRLRRLEEKLDGKAKHD